MPRIRQVPADWIAGHSIWAEGGVVETAPFAIVLVRVLPQHAAIYSPATSL